MHAYNNVALTRKTDKASNLIVKENFLNIFVSQGKCDKGGLGKNSPKNQLKNKRIKAVKGFNVILGFFDESQTYYRNKVVTIACRNFKQNYWCWWQ